MNNAGGESGFGKGERVNCHRNSVFTAGCKKDIGTCFSKFNNVVNFRGFNLIPGVDAVTRYPTSDQTANGASLFNGVS